MNTLDNKVRFLWLDVETTGLDPDSDLLLEIAAWPTRSADPFDLNPLDVRRWVIQQSGAVLGAALSEFTWRMHTANGLLPEVIESKNDWTRVSQELPAMLGVDVSNKAMRDPVWQWKLAGNSVHFDRSFLKTNYRSFESLLTHQNLDVSSLLLAARSAGAEIPKPEPAHRAMDDVKESIRLYHSCMQFFNKETISEVGLESILAQVSW